MGEKIRNLGSFKIKNNEVLIELNEGYDKNTSKYDIHIQSERVQYCLSNADFVRLASAVLCANERLNALKKDEEQI